MFRASVGASHWMLVGLIACIACVAIYVSAAVDSSSPVTQQYTAGEHTLEVWHALNSKKTYQKRGYIKLHLGAMSKRSQNKYEPESGDSLLNDASSIDKNSIYYIKLVGESIPHGLNASIKWERLQTAGFREYFTIHLDETGVPFHVDYIADISKKPANDFKNIPSGANFKPQIAVARTVDAMRPRLDQIVAETKDGKPQPQQTFLQKYWWYIIPILVMLLMSGGGEEEAPAKK